MKRLLLTMLILGCALDVSTAQDMTPTFEDDIAFLKAHKNVVILSDTSGMRQVAVIPDYQCRIMTSTASGEAGTSFGWVNRDLIASGRFMPHINVFGGEDRFWIGPEGGQYSIFFAKDSAFDLDHWFTPGAIDTEPFPMVARGDDYVRCRKDIHLTNYSGTTFNLEVTREVHLLTAEALQEAFGISVTPGMKWVAFESQNSIKNAGTEPWTKEKGLLSIWILGMLNASPSSTIVVPFKSGTEGELGPVVNDAYFGKVPKDRLVVRDGILFFAADAKYRSKIGVSPRRSTSVVGSFDATNHVLTVVQFTLPEGSTDYVNSMWKIQDDPYGGDAVNSYNDGPTAPDKPQMGKFYELESSSPALKLAPGETAVHVHRTMHFQGNDADLNQLARTFFGVGLDYIKHGLEK